MGRATNFVSFKALEETKQDNHNKTQQKLLITKDKEKI